MSTRLTRKLRIEAAATDLPADAPIPVTIATSAPIPRDGMNEVLDCTPAGVDLGRAPLSLIVGHDTSRLAIGLVEQIKAEGQRVTGVVRFGTSPEAQQVRADVLAGIHAYLSVGYMLLDEGSPIEGGMAYRWQPYEVSIVSVPADPGAGFFRSFSGANMPTPVIQSRDAAEITTLCQRHGLGSFADGLIARGLDMGAARAAVLEELARRDLASGGHLNTRDHEGTGNDERQAIVNSLAARMGVRVQGPIIHSTDCVGLAVRALQLSGARVRDSDSKHQILERAFQGASDFPILLGNAVERVLHESYATAPAALKAVAHLTNMPDFRARSVVRLGGAPSLEKVNEHGEFTYGQVVEAGNAWRLATFGRIIALTRQAMVNDDLSGFAGLLQKFGQAAARREAEELVSVLLAPPDIDGSPLFHADRKTLIADKLDLEGLAAAVQSLRAQKDIDGGIVAQEPGTLVVPSALEMAARQLVATFTATKAGDVQPFTLGVAVEPRLDAASATGWYLVAGNQNALEYGYLDGSEGVQITQREGFEIDGLEIKARLDFGCGWAAPVGWVKSTGVS